MRLLLAAIVLYPILAQPEPSPETLLERIRQKVRQNLTRLPDYTCRLTIQRSTGLENSRRLKPLDTVRIEVGYLDGNELYAWPGQKFENVKLEDMLPSGGTVATGEFALHVKSIFLSNAAVFSYAGHSIQEGRDLVQFQYRVPRARSFYVLRSGPNRQATVGYQGSFWADSRTLNLQRLEITLDDIPAQLRIRRAGSTLTYAVTRIVESDFLLPHTSELFIVDQSGHQSRNITRFENCRQFSGESVVSFAEVARTAVDAPKALTDLHLPVGVLVEMSLASALDGDRVAIGDPISAVVSHDISKAGAVIIPKGARVTGRVTRIGQVTRGRVTYHFVGMQLSTVEFADRRAQLNAALESLALAAVQTEVGRGTYPAEGLLFVKGNSLRIPAGAHMLWRTITTD